jgi:hypothetical protein
MTVMVVAPGRGSGHERSARKSAFASLGVNVRASGGSTAFYLLPFVVTEVPRSKRNTGMGFRARPGWPGPGPKGAGTRFEIKKPKSRAGGTAGAAVHPKTKTTDPTSWEVEVPW